MEQPQATQQGRKIKLTEIRLVPDEDRIEFPFGSTRLSGTRASLNRDNKYVQIDSPPFQIGASFHGDDQRRAARKLVQRINSLGEFGREPASATATGIGRRSRLICSACGAATPIEKMFSAPDHCAGCGVPFEQPSQEFVRRAPVRGGILMAVAAAWFIGFWGAVIYGGIQLAHLAFPPSNVNAEISKAAGVRETGCKQNASGTALAHAIDGPSAVIYICNSGDSAEERNGKWTIVPIGGSTSSQGQTQSAPSGPARTQSAPSPPCIFTSNEGQLCGQEAWDWCDFAWEQAYSHPYNPGPSESLGTQEACAQISGWAGKKYS